MDGNFCADMGAVGACVVYRNIIDCYFILCSLFLFRRSCESKVAQGCIHGVDVDLPTPDWLPAKHTGETAF